MRLGATRFAQAKPESWRLSQLSWAVELFFTGIPEVRLISADIRTYLHLTNNGVYKIKK